MSEILHLKGNLIDLLIPGSQGRGEQQAHGDSLWSFFVDYYPILLRMVAAKQWASATHDNKGILSGISAPHSWGIGTGRLFQIG